MSVATTIPAVEPAPSPQVLAAVEREVRTGLTAHQKTLSPWLFYDAEGSALFEQITALPEYYPTRTERSILAAHADEIVRAAAGREVLTILELGAGTAAKTGLILEATARAQKDVLYRPIDVSATALQEAKSHLEREIAGLRVEPQVADYTTQPLTRGNDPGRTLALYIGSSIGNFSPADQHDVLRNLRAQLRHGDALLLGTDLEKDEETLLAAYNDAAGVTAAFNINVLRRLNRELGADFDLHAFRHIALWNPRDSRIEMHLQSLRRQRVHFPSLKLEINFEPGETIHTENSHKFTVARVEKLVSSAGFTFEKVWRDDAHWFAVTLARAI